MLLQNIPATRLVPGDLIFYGAAGQPNELVLAISTHSNKVHVDVKYGDHHQTDIYSTNDKFTILSVK